MYLKLYPINIHSCAEAILLNGELSENPSAKVIFNGLIDPFKYYANGRGVINI